MEHYFVNACTQLEPVANGKTQAPHPSLSTYFKWCYLQAKHHWALNMLQGRGNFFWWSGGIIPVAGTAKT